MLETVTVSGAVGNIPPQDSVAGLIDRGGGVAVAVGVAVNVAVGVAVDVDVLVDVGVIVDGGASVGRDGMSGSSCAVLVGDGVGEPVAVGGAVPVGDRVGVGGAVLVAVGGGVLVAVADGVLVAVAVAVFVVVVDGVAGGCARSIRTTRCTVPTSLLADSRTATAFRAT
jgi:hypothetical protein